MTETPGHTNGKGGAKAMEHLHQELDLAEGETVEVNLVGTAANVLLLDDANYQNYKLGRPYDSRGGYARTTPFRIQPPHPGKWHLVVDLGGGPGRVTGSVSVISEALT